MITESKPSSTKTCEIRAKDQQIEAGQERIEDLIANHHVPRSGAIDTVVVVVEKNADEDTKEHKRAKNFDKLMLRCQKKQVNWKVKRSKSKVSKHGCTGA